MLTDDLIDRLSGQARPIARNVAARRLAIGLGLGAGVTTLMMWQWLGVRGDLAQAVGGAPFWLKFAYTLSIALLMAWLLERLARPGARSRRQALLGLVPLAVVIVLAMLQLAGAEAGAREHLVMGRSHLVCPWRILTLSAPLLAGALWALAGLAPTRPVVTGAVAGLCAGAAAAFIYAFHCRESAMPFLAIWYSLGILLSGAVGALFGRFALRW